MRLPTRNVNVVMCIDLSGDVIPSFVMPRPTFDHLVQSPYKSAWGLYGSDDELGTINLITPETIKRAVLEVQHGKRIPLNLPLNVPCVPMNPARKPMGHNVIAKGHANDDEIHINTQSSSHWDGLRHYPYQSSKQFYNGASQDDISGEEANGRLGVDRIAQVGIIARAVLLDYRTWATSQGIHYSPFETHRISVAQLEAVAADQGVEFLPGDILIIRSGWTEYYRSLDTDQQSSLGGRGLRTYVGIEQSEEMLRWHWDHAFAAVAGDTNAYEAWPPKPVDGKMETSSCHEVFLSGWGMPIGEVWDLEDLARECRELNKWSFLLTSQPINLPAGVASPANVMAIL